MPQDAVELEVKFLDSLEIKDEVKGEIEAVIATLNVVDHDHDIIRPGAIPDGAKVKLSDYGHSVAFGAAPVGKGVLRQKGNKIVFQGHYFMTTDRGVEAFKTIKELGPGESEWSFGFTVEGAEMPDEKDRTKGAWRVLTKLDSFEVSPVIRGAGIGTRTVSVKAAGASAPPPPPAEPDPAPAEPPAEPPAEDPPAEAAPADGTTADGTPVEPPAAEVEDPAEVERKEAEAAAQRKLQADIDAGVERFQRTQRMYNP